MTETTNKKPWLVRMHHRMRAISFALMFVAASLHIAGKGYSLSFWLGLVLALLVYPHVQYYRACRAGNSVQAEMTSLLVDSILLGGFVAALQFPLWLTFSALQGTLSNNAANKGWRGVGETVLALLGGALLWTTFMGFQFSPETDWPTTLFCIAGLTWYLVAMGTIGFTRNCYLRQTRETLQAREKELLSANECLRKNIEEIDVLQEQLRIQANLDPLTSLYNRRYLDSTLERELARCRREGQSLSLILVDIDHFKKINDTYGHQAGDAVLIQLSAILGGMVRSGDVACRYGGEEFLLLMPTMSLEAAKERAEDLRAMFGEMTLPFGDFRLQTTISIGISVYPGHGTSADELIKCADHALYQAKHGGRNRVVDFSLSCNPAVTSA